MGLATRRNTRADSRDRLNDMSPPCAFCKHAAYLTPDVYTLSLELYAA
jgi:hypothetical protein